MKLFTSLYDWALRQAERRNAPRVLAALSFAESSFFPVPPDVMLIPMVLAQPQRAWFLAGLTTLASTLGGLLGYLIGTGLYSVLLPWLDAWGYGPKLEQVQAFFDTYGVWVVLAAGFSPIPYKLFTIMAGAMAMPLLPFMLASAVGRGARFFLVAALARWGGLHHADRIRRSVEWVGWGTLVVLVVIGIWHYQG